MDSEGHDLFPLLFYLLVFLTKPHLHMFLFDVMLVLCREDKGDDLKVGVLF